MRARKLENIGYNYQSRPVRKSDIAFGLEMEVHRSKLVDEDSNKYVVPSGKSPDKIAAHYDCSLYNNGIEFVTAGAVPVKKLLKGAWLKSSLEAMVKHNNVLEGIQPSGYGLHINVNCQDWSGADVIAFQIAMGLVMAHPRVDHIRGRMTERWYKEHPPQNSDEFPPAYDNYNIGSIFFGILGARSDTCAGFRGNRMEVRGFQMNTNPKMMRQQIRLVNTVRLASRKYKNELISLIIVPEFLADVKRADKMVDDILKVRSTSTDYAKTDENVKGYFSAAMGINIDKGANELFGGWQETSKVQQHFGSQALKAINFDDCEDFPTLGNGNYTDVYDNQDPNSSSDYWEDDTDWDEDCYDNEDDCCY